MPTNEQVKVLSQVQEVLDIVKERTIENVFFVACGGSSALMYPSKYLLDREAKKMVSDLYSSNEFIHRNPNTLGKNSLVILCSLEGVTPETVFAAQFANEKGALTVGLTNEEGSHLAKNVDCVVKFEFGDQANAFDTNYSIMYQLTMGLLNVVEGNEKFEKMVTSLSNLQTVYDKVKVAVKENALQFGEDYKDEKVIYTIGSGANYGVAYSFAICILMEMQWIHSHAIHAGEYFHGPFEILDEKVPFIHLLGLDETRPLEERALEFAKRYGKRLIVLDAKEYDLSGIDEEMEGYIAPLVLNYVLRVYANALADARQHPLSTRRYMWKVDYHLPIN
ncbi:SIS domain-containing protein [Halalkalibacter alkalisediminis]|uniref:Fructosamine deglycase n=1 Tax=Halalkalibacter alkalisediminis TaxID=935616 RepID=A0ABV6NEE5_9BACI|nr:SIS domain-containing protein [Halalkalibacter alkalisediminis]